MGNGDTKKVLGHPLPVFKSHEDAIEIAEKFLWIQAISKQILRPARWGQVKHLAFHCQMLVLIIKRIQFKKKIPVTFPRLGQPLVKEPQMVIMEPR